MEKERSKGRKGVEKNPEDSDNAKQTFSHPGYYLVDPSPNRPQWYFNKKTFLPFFGFYTQVLQEMNGKYSVMVWCLKCWSIYRCQNTDLFDTYFPGTVLKVLHSLVDVFGTNEDFMEIRYNRFVKFLLECLKHKKYIEQWSGLTICEELADSGFCIPLGKVAILIPKLIQFTDKTHQLCSTELLKMRKRQNEKKPKRPDYDVSST